MILQDPSGRPATPGVGTRATLDDLFRRAALRRPQAIALVDPVNRASFTDGAPLKLTYAQADRAITAIAGRLRRLGLHTDAIVGFQTANTVESVLSLLAIIRAGLIAMPLPLLWRRLDALAALGRVGASALIVSGRVGEANHFEVALDIAAEVFPIRYVCGFGRNPPDGLIPLDDLVFPETLDPFPAVDRERAAPPGPSAHLAVITWDVAPDGLVPVGRSHAEMIAGGLAVLLEGKLAQDAVLLSTLTMSSFSGLSVTVLPWLLLGGTLVLHQPFDQATFANQRQTTGSDTIVLPGPLVAPIADSGLLAANDGLKRVVAVWRTPERLPRAPAWRDTKLAVVDVHVFGEIGLLVARRGTTGRPTAIPFGTQFAPRGAKGAIPVAEVIPTNKGTIALRGPMVPRAPFPPGSERTTFPHLRIAANGFVDTGYACRTDEDTNVVAVTGPPPGVIGVGGYRFVVSDLQEIVRQVDDAATLAVLPDALAGHRLAGSAADRGKFQEALVRRGANPLLVGAFRERRPTSPAA